MWRVISWVLFTVAAVSISFAVAWFLALGRAPIQSTLFAIWCGGLGVACQTVPRWWLRDVQYLVTANHVIWARGPFRRTIERKSISFARIFWDREGRNLGDIQLVRAVPTGALRRRLAIKFLSVRSPNTVWAIVRGEQDVAAPARSPDGLLSQRLDVGENVIWSSRPKPMLKAYLPHGPREWSLLGIAAILFVSVGIFIRQGVPALSRILEGGLAATDFAFLAVAFGLSVTALLLISVAGSLLYEASIRPGYNIHNTRYLITEKRVLIQRGHEELHIDRSKIVEVIDTPGGDGLRDLFFVLDGPRARALAAHGAFGEVARGPHLSPIFEAVADAASVSRILAPTEPQMPPPTVSRAA